MKCVTGSLSMNLESIVWPGFKTYGSLKKMHENRL